MGHSPQKWVTPVDVEGRPEKFSFERIGNTFVIRDPDGGIIRRRATVVALINKAYPDVSLDTLDDAQITYYDYAVLVEL